MFWNGTLGSSMRPVFPEYGNSEIALAASLSKNSRLLQVKAPVLFDFNKNFSMGIGIAGS
tara:strand:- start:1008 stop:1187 length:180 start_codon:yes stop_codon:yes gene_type:complete